MFIYCPRKREQWRNAKMRYACIVLVLAMFLVRGTPGASLVLSDSTQRKIVRLSLETGELEAEIADKTSASAFAYDPVEKEIYWFEFVTGEIKKSDLSGNSVSVVVNITVPEYYQDQEYPEYQEPDFPQFNPFIAVAGMALDPEARVLFYSFSGTSQITAFFLDNGTEVSLFESSQFLFNAGDIVLDTDNRRLYWSFLYEVAGISSSDYDGTDQTDTGIFQSGQISNPYFLDFDQKNKILFWSESTSWSTTFYSAKVNATGVVQDVNGSGIKTLLEEFNGNTGIGYLDGRLYVSNTSSNNENESFYYIPAEGGDKTFIDIGGYSPDVFQIIPGDEFDAFRPDIFYELVDTGDDTSELVFFCNFSQQADAVTYKTSWFVNNNLLLTTSSGPWNNGDVIRTQSLTETQLKANGITTFGIEVTCSVEATFSAGNMTTSPESFKKFIGIEVTKSPSSLTEGQSGDVQLSLTAPFGCGRNTPDAQCKLIIDVLPTVQTTSCSKATLITSTCRLEFMASSWDTPLSLTVSARVTTNYALIRQTVNLKLKTASFSSQTPWGANMVTVGILVTKTPDNFRSRNCGSNNDPHMQTFDGRPFELHSLGNFTLYRHKILPIEVQIQTTVCSSFNPNIFCNCGVVIRAGSTVFQLNRCPSQESYWDIDYLQCEEGSNDLIVKRRRNSLNYMIYLPTGGYVQVSGYSRLINIQIYPSQLDVDNTEGLCGLMSQDGSCSDDFYLRDGNYSSDPTSTGPCNAGWNRFLPLFSESWRVPDSENLYNETYLDSLDMWPQKNIFCTCPDPTAGAGAATQPICTVDQAVETCTTLPGFEDVSSDSCTVVEGKKRRRRSVPYVTETKNIRSKRSVAPIWINGWTQASAESYCDDLFRNSTSIQTCATVPGVDIDDGKRICVADISFVGTTEFAIFAIDMVVSRCLREAQWNQDLSIISPGSNESVFAIITRDVCPSDCSWSGTCINGECICNPNFGGGACDVDLTTAPSLVDIETNGLCDSHTEDCDIISVFGVTFVDGARCRMELVLVTRNEERDSRVTVRAEKTRSVSELLCARPTAQNVGGETEFVTAYRVSVANSGNLYSNKLGLVVYDSRCIIPFVNGLNFQWTIQGPYCLYRGVCYEDNANLPGDDSRRCNGETNTWVLASTGNPFLDWWRRWCEWFWSRLRG